MIRWLTILSCTFFVAAEAHAAPVFYTPSAYLSSADSPFSGPFQYSYLENFEDGSFNVPGVTMTFTGATAFGITIPGNIAVDSVDGDDGNINGFGRNGRSLAFAGPERTATIVTFTFNPAAPEFGGLLPTHAGLVWTDVGRPISGATFGQPGYGVTDVWFEAFDAIGDSLGNTPFLGIGDGATDGRTAEDRFFGVFNADGISKITFTVNSTDWEMDHLQYAAVPQQTPEVPEPSSALLALLGAVGAYGLKRRRLFASA